MLARIEVVMAILTVLMLPMMNDKEDVSQLSLTTKALSFFSPGYKYHKTSAPCPNFRKFGTALLTLPSCTQ